MSVLANSILVKGHFNTHLEGLDLVFWHDLIEIHGKLMSLKMEEYLCRKGKPTSILKSGH